MGTIRPFNGARDDAGDGTPDPNAGTGTVIVTNVTIATSDSRRPWVTAAFLRNHHLVALGAAAEILKKRAPDTHIIDGQGQTVELPPGMTVGQRIQVRMDHEGRISFVFEEEV